MSDCKYAVIVQVRGGVNKPQRPQIIGIFDNVTDAFCAMHEFNRTSFEGSHDPAETGFAAVFKQVELRLEINPS